MDKEIIVLYAAFQRNVYKTTPNLFQILRPQDARVLVKVTSGVKDRNASSTVVTTTTGTMDAGVMQTSIAVRMLRPIQHLRFRMFQALELAEQLVSQVNIYICLDRKGVLLVGGIV